MSDHMTGDRPWTHEAVGQLKELAKNKIGVSVISLKLKRSVPAVRAKLAELGVSVPAEV